MATSHEDAKRIMAYARIQHAASKATSKDEPTDKIKLTREERTKLCQEKRLGIHPVGEDGLIGFQHITCDNYDICSDCCHREAEKRQDAVEHNFNEFKKENSEAKKRVKRGVPESEVEALEKRIKRHGGTFHSAEGELPGTKDIVAVMEDDPKRDSQEMDDIYGIEDEYDYAESLARQAERSAEGEQKRMAGKLLRKASPAPEEGTYRLRLPYFRIRPEFDGIAAALKLQCWPTVMVNDEDSHQEALYHIAAKFGLLLEERGIEYDLKVMFRNVKPESRDRFNDNYKINRDGKCPVNSPISTNKGVSRTKVDNESAEVEESGLERFIRELVYPGTSL
jgi:hypothetical protein